MVPSVSVVVPELLSKVPLSPELLSVEPPLAVLLSMVPPMLSVVMGIVVLSVVVWVVDSVVFQISSLVGSTVGAEVLSIFRLVQPQPTKRTAVSTNVSARVTKVFIFFPPYGIGFNGSISAERAFRQEIVSIGEEKEELAKTNDKSLKKQYFFVAFLSIHMYNGTVNK